MLSTAAGQRLLAAGVLAFLVAAPAFRILWLGPQRDGLEMRRAELDQRRAEVHLARRAAGRLPGLEAEAARLRRRRDELGRSLPKSREAGALLRSLQEIARRSGLTTETFALAAVRPREPFEEWPVRLELTGAFDGLMRFLDEVSRLPRVVTVSRMSIRALPAGTGRRTLAVTCMATTYVLRKSDLEEGAVDERRGG
jgi:type IV pilus assembly protein PilO